VPSRSYYYYLFLTPKGSTTQHRHYKDRRKPQETKNYNTKKLETIKANHTAHETVVHASVHMSFLE